MSSKAIPCRFSSCSNSLNPISRHKFATTKPLCFPIRSAAYDNYRINKQEIVPEVTASPVRRSINDNIEVIQQESILSNGSLLFGSRVLSNGLENTINEMSKWLVIASYIAVILWKHNAELSITLKHILNHDRPVSTLRSDPGMPSSHAQSIFFVVVFFILSMVITSELNGTTVFMGVLALSLGSYLSWLRISQNLHTISQVFAGAIVGATFSLLWFHAWHAFVLEAFVASPLVQTIVVLGSAAFLVGLCLYALKHLLKEETYKVLHR
ncbi:hypothetical protein AQUCO_08500011v1 [Aquilegia coerulea]|uniref:Phosphatidic acid phosphatase type 2/haloperoxidase domain-containing protein n=1 Tax=Aquilegia coerulea TaxID=218851 RepID=A0A2G5C6M1_AQUCA|nr:hypothetical protein AQUCO_08500011v1 [Aquilegia coerulea]